MFGISGVYAFTAAGSAALEGHGRSMLTARHGKPEPGNLYERGMISMAGPMPPVQDPTGRYTIVFTGKIFNYGELRSKLQGAYTFHTDLEAELVLQLYIKEGQEFLKRLRGLFALAIYDQSKESLFIARDRYGEKPLLYYKDADKLLFGSDLATLATLGVPRELDQTSLYQYLQLAYVPAPASILKGIKKLLPGHFLYLKDNKLHQKMWYRLPYDPGKAAANPLSYKQQQAKLEKLLEQSIESRLDGARAVGVLLDGSIESTIVAALTSQQVPGLKTYSISFAGQEDADTRHYTHLLAQKYRTVHTEYRVTTQDMYTGLEAMLDSLSEPFASPATMGEYMLCNRARQDVGLVFSGHGANELFAGYNRHMLEYQVITGGVKAGMTKRLGFLWNLLLNPRNSFAANKVRQLRQLTEGTGMSHRERYWQWAALAAESEGLALLDTKLAGSARNRLYLARKQRLLSCLEENQHNLNNVLCADWQLVLANDVLARIDIIGKANRLELRSPFLDHRIVKFAFSLPVSSKIDAGVQKKIVHDTFKSRIPKELTGKISLGSEFPWQSLLQGEARPLADRYLSDSFIRNQGIFDLGKVQRLRAGMSVSKEGQGHAQVWNLIVFQHWWQKWMH